MKSDKKYKFSVPIPLIPFDDSSYEAYVRMLKEMDAENSFF